MPEMFVYDILYSMSSRIVNCCTGCFGYAIIAATQNTPIAVKIQAHCLLTKDQTCIGCISQVISQVRDDTMA